MLPELCWKELKYKAEMVIMNEHSLDICENNVKTRTEGP